MRMTAGRTMTALAALATLGEPARPRRTWRCCTGGPRAARPRRLNVLKQDLETQGIGWQDMPVAGGGGTQAMTVLRARVTSGNPPAAVQMLGFDILDWAQGGRARQPQRIADRGGLGRGGARGAPQFFTKYDGHWVAAPVNVHSTNWVWANKAVLDELGIAAADHLGRVHRGASRRSRRPARSALAHGGQPWQDATIFDAVVMSTGGPEFYKAAMIDLDPEALGSEHDEGGLRPHDGAPRLRRRQLLRPRLEPRLRHGDQRRGRLPDHGRLGQGRVPERRQGAGPGLPLLPLPRHRGAGHLQLRPVRHVQAGRRGRRPSRRRSPRRSCRRSSRSPSTR